MAVRDCVPELFWGLAWWPESRASGYTSFEPKPSSAEGAQSFPWHPPSALGRGGPRLPRSLGSCPGPGWG